MPLSSLPSSSQSQPLKQANQQLRPTRIASSYQSHQLLISPVQQLLPSFLFEPSESPCASSTSTGTAVVITARPANGIRQAALTEGSAPRRWETSNWRTRTKTPSALTARSLWTSTSTTRAARAAPAPTINREPPVRLTPAEAPAPAMEAPRPVVPGADLPPAVVPASNMEAHCEGERGH